MNFGRNFTTKRKIQDIYIYTYIYCDFQFPAIPSRSLAGSPIVNAHGVICGPNVVLDIGSRGGCCTADSPWSGEKGSGCGAALGGAINHIGVSHTGLWVYEITRP